MANKARVWSVSQQTQKWRIKPGVACVPADTEMATKARVWCVPADTGIANKAQVWRVPADTGMVNKALVYCGVSQQTQKWRIKPWCGVSRQTQKWRIKPRCGVYILYSWTPKSTTSRIAQVKLRLCLWHLTTGSVAVAMSLAYDNSMCSCDYVCGIGQIDV